MGQKYDMRRKYTKKVLVTDENSTPEARAERLKRVRNMANLTREQMCHDGAININTYKGWEVARYGGLPVDGAERVVVRVRQEGVVCTADWLLYEIGVGPYVIPDYKSAAEKGGKQAYVVPDNEEQLITNELLLFRKQFPDVIIYTIEDDGLSPIFEPGDFVAGIKLFADNIHKALNKNCIIQTQEGKVLARKLQEGSKAGVYMLTCSNIYTTTKMPVLYDVAIVSAAPIIRCYKKAL
ncbi:MAG TPA: hypothetical protein VHE99_09915 [Gammaproteobacteria bacterium]|nr:hypothetical protein [Gammaproteobacteria bacterium]